MKLQRKGKKELASLELDVIIVRLGLILIVAWNDDIDDASCVITDVELYIVGEEPVGVPVDGAICDEGTAEYFIEEFDTVLDAVTVEDIDISEFELALTACLRIQNMIQVRTSTCLTILMWLDVVLSWRLSEKQLDSSVFSFVMTKALLEIDTAEAL